MSDETYYTVLNVKETASAAEIKTAYRDLIKQVHPDTIATLAPYLRKIAEDKAKEITEAYGVLSNSSKRRDYDRQLAAYRQQSAPQAAATPEAPPTPPQQQSQCPICGRSDGGHSAACANQRTSRGASATPSATTATPAATAKVIRGFGYNWGPLLDWAGEHPLMVVFLFLVGVFSIGALFSDSNTQSSSSSSPTSSASATPVTNNAKTASTGPYSAYPCDYREKVSSIDGKPCAEKRDSIPSPPPGFKPVSGPATTNHPAVSVAGVYVGTVNNQTANLSSSFTVVVYPTKTRTLEGCIEVKPPLYGSGALRGSITGSRVNFIVADITFQGDATKDVITGSYVVTRQTGNQLGTFRLTKQPGLQQLYGCADGALVEVEVQKPKPKPVAKSSVRFATVTSDYATIDKRCAFLPYDNYGRCNYQPETVAKPRKYDRLTVLSPLTRAENGDDIYKVRTEQGWVGWIESKFIHLEE